MIRIASNARSVALRLDAFEKQLPSALATAFDRDQWHTVLSRHAEQILNALATPEEKALIPPFIATVMVVAFGDLGFQASMSRPGGGQPATLDQALEVFERLYTRQYGNVRRRRQKPLEGSEDDERILNEVDAAIEEWVATEKRKTQERDGGYTNAEIAQRIRWILFVPSPSPAQEEAAPKLARAISGWMQERVNNRGSATLLAAPDAWLLAVLAGWRDLVLSQLPARFRQEIRKLWRKTEGSLI